MLMQLQRMVLLTVGAFPAERGSVHDRNEKEDKEKSLFSGAVVSYSAKSSIMVQPSPFK